ncbi:hypothetical protein DIPPA_29006 [Diplonema papillatum]|nr:hypothetical protein DIPPA_29006 [Diplonema papillatum]|eukprot:gene6275-9620_t
MFSKTLPLLALVAGVACQDPAQGWLSYAKGVNPDGEGIITRAEAKWTVLDAPKADGCFYSPWFGIETSDNLNLFQPVNPWAGKKWEMYLEYFQWSPTHNQDSQMEDVQPGNTLHGVVTLNQSANTYTGTITNMATGKSSSMTIPIQKHGLGDYKRYTIMYVVFEKSCRSCRQYPPNDKVVFSDIIMEFNNKTVKPTWTTSFVDDVCNNRAEILDSSTVQITWNSTS